MTDDHPFGDVDTSEAVMTPDFDPLAGYQPRVKRVYQASRNRWIRTDTLKGTDPVPAEVEQPHASHAMSVYDCIVAVSRDLAQDGISKTRQNAQQGYQFRGIDDVLNALSPLLAKYRLVILPRILSRVVTERQTQKGGVLFSVTVEAEFDFVSAADGSTHTVKTYGEAMDSADKATNKAMSAAYKYAAFQTFCIPTEGDHDADAVTPDEVKPQRPVATQPKAKPPHAEDAVGWPSPDAFKPIDKYKVDAGGWHQIAWGRDAQGGAMIYKTKLEHVGNAARDAYAAKLPVKIHSKKFPFVDRVEVLERGI